MAHLVALGGEVADAVGLVAGDDRHLVDDLEAVAMIHESVGLLGVVRQEPDLAQAEVLEDLEADAVIPLVGPEAQGEVRLDGVHPLILEVVRPDLLDQADPTPLLGQIDQGPNAVVGDHLEAPCGAGRRSRIAAIGADRP